MCPTIAQCPVHVRALEVLEHPKAARLAPTQPWSCDTRCGYALGSFRRRRGSRPRQLWPLRQLPRKRPNRKTGKQICPAAKHSPHRHQWQMLSDKLKDKPETCRLYFTVKHTHCFGMLASMINSIIIWHMLQVAEFLLSRVFRFQDIIILYRTRHNWNSLKVVFNVFQDDAVLGRGLEQAPNY